MLILYRILRCVYWLSQVDLVHRYSEFYLETWVQNPTLNQPMQSQLFRCKSISIVKLLVQVQVLAWS